MFNKNKRMLWLLNHKTLMPYEAPLIQRLGFEIYIPKIFPKSGFRSGAVDAAYDASLTLPVKALAKLNAFNFYESEWTPEIVAILNRYFGTAFIIPHARLTEEAVDNFEGQLIFRAFGLDNAKTYRAFLEDLYGPLVMRKIVGIKERFWFGEGYDHLHECEEPIFAERSLFLPIGIPNSFFSTANQWTGKEKKILFVCPNAVTDSYYSGIYKKFKSDFGDLPHVIVGAQDVPVPDPHVAGFVSDEELKRLYLECAVLYYHSVEVRHVHYSPIEAAINGMPVVYFKGSLLDRLSQNASKGRVSTVDEARALIKRILDGDKSLVSEIKLDQREIAYLFSDAYCGPMWKKQMEERGFIAALRQRTKLSIFLEEIKRTLMMPFAHGRTKVNPHWSAIKPFDAKMNAIEAKEEYGGSLYDGISFAHAKFPAMVDYISGVGANESWGRWSNDKNIVIVLKHLLQGEFRLNLRAVGFEKNAGVPIPVKIGSQTRSLSLAQGIETATGAWLHFNLKKPSNIIEITVPHPTRPAMDSRTVGIGLIEISVAPPVSMDAVQAKESFGSSLDDGIDFRLPEFPAFVESISGISLNEHWGRWSIGEHVVIELKHILSGAFRLLLCSSAFGPNVGVPILVRIGHQTRTIRLSSDFAPDEVVSIEFDLSRPSNVIEITVPFPTTPSGDSRQIGIGFSSLRLQRS